MSKNVSTPCSEYILMTKNWDLPDDLLEGTLAMRSAGTKWLPRETAEMDDKYLARLNRSVLYNCYSDTLDKLVGKPFSKPVIVSGLPEEFEEYLKDINGAGQRFHDFAKEVFREAVHCGLTHILVDYSRSVGNETLAEEKEKGLRPFLVHISPKNLVGWNHEIVGNRPVLSEIRILEKQTVKSEQWDEEVKTFIRVIHPNDWQLWEKGKDDTFILVDSGMLSLGAIPLVTVYFNRKGYLTGTPCLEDLAWMNLAHWQSYSDQRNILRFARTGLLFIKGLSDDELSKQVTVGPNQTFKTVNENADMKFVELGTGGSITAGKDDLVDIESKMDRLGMRPLSARSGSDTATGKAIDEGNENTDIHSWISSAEVVLTSALELALEWKGIGPEEDFEVKIFSEFALSVKADSDLRVLDAARARNDLTRRTYLQELKRRAVLGETVDIEAEDTEASKEQEAIYGVGQQSYFNSES